MYKYNNIYFCIILFIIKIYIPKKCYLTQFKIIRYQKNVLIWLKITTVTKPLLIHWLNFINASKN